MDDTLAFADYGPTFAVPGLEVPFAVPFLEVREFALLRSFADGDPFPFMSRLSGRVR